jgi:teichuronic acid biosynthesis glycosyltransferase TuaC
MLSHMYPSAVSRTSGVFVHEQCLALRRRGHDVRVVSPTGWAPPLLSRWAAHREVPGTTTIQGVPVLYPRMLSLPGARLGRRNCEAMHLGVARAVKRVHRRWPFDVIHAHMVVPDGWVAARLGARFGVPVVATAHRADVLDVPARGSADRARVGEAVGMVDQLCAVSRVVGDAATALGAPRRPVRVVPNGADTETCRPWPRDQMRREFGLPVDGQTITYVGQLVPRKGVDALIDALARLAARPEGAPLLAAAGSGPQREELEARARDRGVADRVRFVGRVDHDRVGRFMAAGDLFVLPSLSEGLPTVVCEAMNCGLPVVATAVDGTPEIVRDGRTGLLVPPSDPDALAGALAAILDDPERARHMGEEALRIGRTEYTWDANAATMEAIYREVRAGGPAGG